MDSGIVLIKENPRKKANILSVLCFTWMIGLFRKGVKKGLDVMDLYKTLDYDKSAFLGDKLEANWKAEVIRAKEKGGEASLYTALAKTFLPSYMIYGGLMFIEYVVLKAFQPLVLGYLVNLFSPNVDEPDLKAKMYISASLMILISVVVIFINHHTNFGMMTIGARVRVAVSSLIYRKILKLSKKSLGQTAAGQVVNLLSNDVARFDFISLMLHYFWISPFVVAIITYYLWDAVGVSCLAGVLSMILFTLPVQGYLGKITTTVRTRITTRTDKRVRLMSEIISGIQVIKMYAWEKPLEKIVKTVRAKELNALRHMGYIRSIFISCMVFVERMTLFLTIITYVLLDNVITADKVFSMSQLYNQLQLVLAFFIPLAISIGAETIVSMRRFQAFLVMEEKSAASVEIKCDKKIAISKVQASWTFEPTNLTLDNINFEIPAGKLCAIIGPVGSGKSSVFQLLLGELPMIHGNVSVYGSMSYSSQEPWLFGATVRNNILFGQEYNRQHYHHVTKACALLPDFNQFPQRDKTMVGERGVSLSGGQRARINLARAIYREADIYLMDDPLSAVDTHVGKHLFDECIMKYLKGKTRILITHQLQYLKKADLIIVLNNGKIEAQGTFGELANSEFDFTKMLVAADETTETKPQVGKPILERSVPTVCTTGNKSFKENEEEKETNEEEIGLVGKSATMEYLKAAGSCGVIFSVFSLFVLAQVACSGADYWVTYWTQQEILRHANDTEVTKYTSHSMLGTIDQVIESGIQQSNIIYNKIFDITENKSFVEYKPTKSTREFDWDLIVGQPIDTNWAIYIYTAIIVTIIFLTLFRSFAFFRICITASKNLHSMMFHCLLKARMRFFDINPTGRVLNRFSKDMGAVDEALPRIAIEAIQAMLVMAGILVMIAISNYYMIIAIVVFVIMFVFLRKWYLRTVRVLKHIEGIVKSPVFTHLNSSLNGISTIRALQAESELIEQFDKLQDVHSSAWFLTLACKGSFGLWIDFICVIFTAIITFSFIVLNQAGSINGSMVGLAISQSLILTNLLQYGMRQSAEVVNQMVGVERILHYTTLDMEGPFETPPNKTIPKEWPFSGNVNFSHVSLLYTPNDPPVIKDLTIDIPHGTKVGIVGRTGAGKSSLIAALFRLAPMQGSIEIDGIDSQSLDLNTLRRHISIIPQEPVLFSATMRYNLDPFGEFEDSKLWNALEEVELKDVVSSLDFVVDEGGANFSIGQRQLICLARAILRNNKILVLDEATANVDPQTDALIQTTIRKKFVDCTVLTIAHRLNTIMDSDKVLVMDAGRRIEFDHPHILLQKNNGYFTKMVEQTGPSMTKTLHLVAYNAYCNTHEVPASIPPIPAQLDEVTHKDTNTKDEIKTNNIITEIVEEKYSEDTVNNDEGEKKE